MINICQRNVFQTYEDHFFVRHDFNFVFCFFIKRKVFHHLLNRKESLSEAISLFKIEVIVYE